MNPRTQLAERMWRAYSVARLNAALSDASATPWVELGYDERSAWLAAARAAEGELLAVTHREDPEIVTRTGYRPREGGVAWRTIVYLDERPGTTLTARQVADLFGCRPANVHDMLQKAERAGLLDRSLCEVTGVKVYSRPPSEPSDEPAALAWSSA